MKKRYVSALLITVVVGVLLVNAPAAWLNPLLRVSTQNTITFSDSWGTVWNGSAQVLVRRSDTERLRIPQPVSWTLAINKLFDLSATLTLTSGALQAPVTVAILGKRVQISAGKYNLPADTLNTLGAPFNTLKPSGDVRLSWADFNTTFGAKTAPAIAWNINVQSLRSSVTGDQVLGSYSVSATPKTPTVNRWFVKLKTDNSVESSAALLLTGNGELGLTGTPQFELKAKAASPQAQQRLQALLNFLGRREGDVYVLRVN